MYVYYIQFHPKVKKKNQKATAEQLPGMEETQFYRCRSK